MPEEPSVQVFPGGPGDEFPDGPPTAVVHHHGIKLELRFAPGDFPGNGDVQEIRLLPDVNTLTPSVLRRIAPDAETYLAFARAALRWFDPADDPKTKQARLRDAAQTLRTLGGPGRRHPDEFYRRIGESYNGLVADGEPHPVKAVARLHVGTISAASRWIKEARSRGYIPPKEAKRA
jgi:hypothetical protein